MNRNQIVKRIDEYDALLVDIEYNGPSFYGERQYIEDELDILQTLLEEIDAEVIDDLNESMLRNEYMPF